MGKTATHTHTHIVSLANKPATFMSLSCDGVFRLCQESQFLRHAHTNLNGLSGPSTQSTQLYFYYVSPHLPHILTVIIYLCNSEQSSCLAADNPTCPLLYALMPILADTSPQHGPCWLKWQISSSAGSAEQERWGFFFFWDIYCHFDFSCGQSVFVCVRPYLVASSLCAGCLLSQES